MKKILALVSVFVTISFVSGHGMLSIVPTASAQEVSTYRNLQDTTAVELSEDRALIASILADSTLQNSGVEDINTTLEAYRLVYIYAINKPRIDSILIAKSRPATTAADSLGVVAEEHAEEVVSGVPNKPYKSVVVKWAGRNRYGKYTEQCAAHVNGRLTRAGHYSQGHAYQILSHFPSVINGYKGVKIPDLSKVSSDKRFSTVLNMHRQAADYVKEHLDISKLVPGKYYVVNMYYTTSPYMLQFFYSARKQGTGNYGTHVGVLYYNTEHEAWIVEHNIHGHVHYDALVSILGGYSNPHKYGVTSISRVSR